MLGWLVCGAIVLIALGFIYRQTLQQKQALEALEALHANSLVEAREESEKRVKRVERASGLDVQRAQYGLMKDMMPALDALDEAVSQSQDDGVALVQRAFDEVLGRHHMTRIAPAVGEAFDPTRHEAIEAVPDAERAPNTIVRAFRHGWGCRDEVIRPALVAVSVAAPTASEPEAEPAPVQAEADEEAVEVQAET